MNASPLPQTICHFPSTNLPDQRVGTTSGVETSMT